MGWERLQGVNARSPPSRTRCSRPGAPPSRRPGTTARGRPPAGAGPWSGGAGVATWRQDEGMEEAFGIVLFFVVAVAIVAAVFAITGTGNLYRQIGRGGLSLDRDDDHVR